MSNIAAVAGPIDRRRFLLASLMTGALTAIAGKGEAAEVAPHADLLRRMTLEEKAGQLHLEGLLSPRMGQSDFQKNNPFAPRVTPAEAVANYKAQLVRIGAGEIGILSGPMDIESVAAAQRAAVGKSRLKIPVIFGADIIHGLRTVFPVPIAEAASFDPELARSTARACAVEATAAGHDITYAPMVDIARDQRWGRVVEGAGEDVLLGSLFAAARVRGFQGDKRGAPDSMLACVKHFAAYGAAESGLDYRGVDISDRLLEEVYLAPFKAAFDAGAILTMASFNTINGVPSSGNHRLLTDILRGEMGFTGAVISDYASERELVAHGFAKDDRDAARLALEAGCDVGMASGIYPKYLPDLVRSGALSETVVDRAIARMLFVKSEAGLFDDPFRRISAKRAHAATPPAHRTLARDAARKSIVLLKNQGALLPLRTTGQRIALIGPFGNDVVNLNGPWSPFFPDSPSVSLADGLRRAMSRAEDLTVVDGSAIDAAIDGGIEQAVTAARASDVVILAIGESTDMSGESGSRAAIVVPAAQQALAEAVTATGKPIVVILRNGRALALDGAVRDAHAILVGWFLGLETGNAIADIVFGKVSPGGRLPMSWPRATGQEPFYYARETTGRPAPVNDLGRFTSHFLDLPDTPLYPFGHGLTYAPVTYGTPKASAKTIGRGDRFWIETEICNGGTVAIEEVVQLYVHDRVATVVQPVRRLIAFRKVALAPGDATTVRFDLNSSSLSWIDNAGQRVVEPGEFRFWAAPSAETGEPVSLWVS